MPAAAADPTRGPHGPEGSGRSGQLSGRPAGRPNGRLSRSRAKRSLKDQQLETPHGVARFSLDVPAGYTGTLLVLGHGAGGDVDAVDLVAVRAAVLDAGAGVAMVTQPYRVAGTRRPPAPARQLDAAWLAVVAELRRRVAVDSLVVGGRSSGARVACRTAVEAGADRILALAFPLHPPGRPDVTRVDELRTGVPTLVLNGDRDPFGVPGSLPTVHVEVLPGETHALSKAPQRLAQIAVAFVTST